MMDGLGKEVMLLRSLVTPRVNCDVFIEGFYDMSWPVYMNWNIGLTPIEENLREDI